MCKSSRGYCDPQRELGDRDPESISRISCISVFFVAHARRGGHLNQLWACQVTVEPDRCSKHAKTPGGSQGNVNVEFGLAQRQVGDQVSIRTPVATKTKHQLPIAARCTFQITIQHMQSTRRKMIPFLQSQHFFKQVSAYSLRRFCCVCMCHVHNLYCPHVHVFHVFKHVCFFGYFFGDRFL